MALPIQQGGATSVFVIQHSLFIIPYSSIYGRAIHQPEVLLLEI